MTMRPNHHLVPRMYLRHFADASGKLTVVARQPPHASHISTVKNACNEVGFYELPAEELDESDPLADGWDPEAVEKFLSQVEGDAAPVIDALVAGRFPLSPADRHAMALFVALQITRGWSYRIRAQRAMDLLGPDLIAINTREEVIRERLAAEGRSASRRAIKNAQRRLAELPTITLPQGYLVATAVGHAMKTCRPLIENRPWRLLQFDEGSLVTSDQPVGLWTPGSQKSVGLATAQMIYMPLNRNTALAAATSGPDKISLAGPTRARQINESVARHAHRWIFHHPADKPLSELDLPPIEEITSEVVTQVEEPDGTTHELVRMVSQPKL
jgi:hypothetical protein